MKRKFYCLTSQPPHENKIFTKKNNLTSRYFLIVVFLMQVAFAPVTARANEVIFAPVPTAKASEIKVGMIGNQIDSLLKKFAQDELSKGMYAGISVYNLSKDTLLYQHEADKHFVPASNLKLFVAVAALEALGANYRFSTEVYSDGEVSENGTLRGNLIIKGGGDPTLEVKHLQKIATQLKEERGIKSIQGRIEVDEGR